MLRRYLLTAAFLAGFAAELPAQVQLGLSGFAGGYVAVTDLFDDLGLGGRTVLNLGQEPGFAVGGRLTLWMSRIAVEAEVAYALSDVDVPEAVRNVGVAGDASVFLGSLNVLYVIFQAPFSPLSIYLSGGGGLVGHGGDFFRPFEDTTDLGVTLGGGLRFGLSRLTHLRFDMRDYIYPFAPSRPQTGRADAKLQNDVVATIALELVFTPGLRVP